MPPRTSPRKRAVPAVVKAEETAVEKPTGAAATAKKQAPKEKKATTPSKKRKAADDSVKVDGHECDSHGEEAEDEPTAKKRKTKKDKVDEMPPLAARTAVSSLKKAMYIGAHVSGAGGRHLHHPLEWVAHTGTSGSAKPDGPVHCLHCPSLFSPCPSLTNLPRL